jgi:hypothetical protein
MAKSNKPPKPAKEQHYISRYYLRHFAEPIFSDNLQVFDFAKRRWERRTPAGVGWSPHLCSVIDMEGRRTDEFDQFLKRHVEDPAAPALKALATGQVLNDEQRAGVAMFIAITAARSPTMMGDALGAHIDCLTLAERAELDEWVGLWSEMANRPLDAKSHAEFLKPGALAAVWVWARDLQRRLLRWQWHMVRTTREHPFVTSDRPAHAEWEGEQGCRLVSFPASSEVALIIISQGQFREPPNAVARANAVNRRTVHGARKFVACWKNSFPGEDGLPRE